MTGDPHLQAHLQFAQANARPKIAKELVSLLPEKNYFLKFPSLRKFFKTATAQPTQKTAKATTYKGNSNSTDKTPAGNSTYPKGGVSCSKDSFVVNQTLVFQMKFCGKSPALRVAAKR